MTENGLNRESADHSRVYVLAVLLLFVMTRTFFLLTPAGRFGDADQAVFGMMAQGIARLKEYPLVWWEAHYSGTPVAYVAAIIFKFFGSGFAQLRLAVIITVLPGFILYYFIYQRLMGSTKAFFGALFLIFCPYLVLNYTTGAYGGYGESFLGTALIILLSWKIKDQSLNIPPGVSYFLLGLTCGFFLYIHFYVIPAILVFALPLLRSVGENRAHFIRRFCLGGFVGIAPLIAYNVQNNGGTITRAAAWILLSGRDDLSAAPLDVAGRILLKKGTYLANWLLNAPFMFGQYVLPGMFGHAAQTAAGFLLILVFIVYIVSSLKERNHQGVAGSYHRQSALYLLVFILFQWVASLHADRHFMPIFFVIPIALLSICKRPSSRLLKNSHLLRFPHPSPFDVPQSTPHGEVFQRPCIWPFLSSLQKRLFQQSAGVTQVPYVFVLLLCAFQVIGWVQASTVRGLDVRPVVKIMESQGIREFYSSYWTGYPIMFLAEGRLIGSPMLLPYHEPFGDRRPRYTAQVDRSMNAAFLFGEGEEASRKDFLSFLHEHAVTSTCAEIHGVRIYYRFSKPVGVSYDKATWSNHFFLK